MENLEEKRIKTKRGFEYRYYVSPASQADDARPVILLCHGWPDSSRLWQYVLPHLLRTKNRLLVPDLLGYGGSSKPTQPKDFEIKAMVTDIMEIFDAEKIASAIIPMGHDWGSYFAQRVYLLNIPRMAGLVTLNVALMPPRQEAFNLEEINRQTETQLGYPLYAYWELFTHPNGPKLMDEHLESVWHAIHGADDGWMKRLFCERGAFQDWLSDDRRDVALKPFARDDGLKNEWISYMKAGGFTAPNCWYRAMKENYQLETEKTLSAKIEKPYLFIGCDGDPVCRTDFIKGSKQAGLVSDLEVTELHSGHWCPLERPKEVATAVLEWLVRKGFAE